MSLTVQTLSLHLTIAKAIKLANIEETTHPQSFQVPSIEMDGPFGANNLCPSSVCRLAGSTGNQARVALIKVDSSSVSMWNYSIVHHRTCAWKLSRQFSEGMLPTLGRHICDDLAQGSVSLMTVALAAMANSESTPASPISSSLDARLEANFPNPEVTMDTENNC